MSQTTLGRSWLIKMIAGIGALLGLGAWGLYDALVAYPRRGEAYASYALLQYLEAARPGGLTARVNVRHPAEELRELRTRGPRNELEQARLEWLRALEVIGQLDEHRTVLDNPDRTYQTLKRQWEQAGIGAPKRLAWYDIPVQWVITAGGFGGAAWLAGLFVRVVRQKYLWDPATLSLHLPDGNVLTPADIDDFDKRRWHKYLVTLRVRAGHPKLGGKAITLDLYRHTPLEDWVLAMERAASPQSASSEPRPPEVAEPEGQGTETGQNA